MLTHPTLKTLSKFIDVALSESRQAAIHGHLEKCPRCKARLDALRTAESVMDTEQTSLPDLSDKILPKLKHVERLRTPPCGEIMQVIGKVVIYHRNRSGVEAFPGMVVRKDDRICTESGARALIRLNDGSELYLNKSTELSFQQGARNVSLPMGQIFAAMKPQKAPFRVLTPSALLSVIGTDFDTKVGEDNSTVLTVLKGRVSFKNQVGETISKPGRQVHASANMRPVASKVREPKEVSRWTRSLKSSKKERTPIMKKLFVTILVIFAALWLFSKFNEGPRPLRISSEAKTIKKLDKTDMLQIASPYNETGLSWRIRVTGEKEQAGQWKPIRELSVLTEVVGVDPQRRNTQMLMTIERSKTMGDPAEQEASQAMVGQSFEYSMGPNGSFRLPTSANGTAPSGLQLMVLLECLGNCQIEIVLDDRSVKPGDSWPYKVSLPLPGIQGAFFRAEGENKFLGYELHDGVELAVFSTTYVGSIEGGVPIEQPGHAENVKEVFLLDYMGFEASRRSFFDVKVGRPVRIEVDSTRTFVKGRGQRLVPGRPLKETPVEMNDPERSRGIIEVEYQEKTLS